MPPTRSTRSVSVSPNEPAAPTVHSPADCPAWARFCLLGRLFFVRISFSPRRVQHAGLTFGERTRRGATARFAMLPDIDSLSRLAFLAAPTFSPGSDGLRRNRAGFAALRGSG